MKLTIAIILALAAPAAAVFQPQKISYASLLKSSDHHEDPAFASAFVKALSETGMVSITGIPNSKTNAQVLSALHECAEQSKATQEHTFPDGARRLTLATRSVPGAIQKIHHQVSTEACDSFNKAAAEFRSTVATVTQAFADRVEQYYFGSLENQVKEGPILSTFHEGVFATFADVVENGEHLEHFHSYQKLQGSQDEEETIEMHEDQGLFIAFTPGRFVNHQDASFRPGEGTSGFFVTLQDGAIEEVKFTEDDDLVIMLGDGVNQYINDKIPDDKIKLRSVPHTLRMNSHDPSVSRVWYGRMVLPPVDAVHPAHSMTFGELRERMIASSLDENKEEPGLGCSGGMVARDLSAVTCEGDSIYCWHRCMNLTDTVNDEACAERNLSVQCINPRLQLWAGENHGDFYPDCASETDEVETPYPTLPEYPRDEEVCTDAEFDTFASTTGYDFSYDLTGGARFMWSLEDDGAVRGRIAYNGLFGFLAFGFADVDGDKNGMHGGKYTQSSVFKVDKTGILLAIEFLLFLSSTNSRYSYFCSQHFVGLARKQLYRFFRSEPQHDANRERTRDRPH